MDKEWTNNGEVTIITRQRSAVNLPPLYKALKNLLSGPIVSCPVFLPTRKVLRLPNPLLTSCVTCNTATYFLQKFHVCYGSMIASRCAPPQNFASHFSIIAFSSWLSNNLWIARSRLEPIKSSYDKSPGS